MPDTPNNPISLSDKEFIQLCAFGTSEAVEQALAAGANPNARDECGWTALMEAARRSNLPVVRILLDAGADVNARYEGNVTALAIAQEKGAPEIVLALLAAGADPDALHEDGDTALQWAAYHDRAEIVAALLAAGADRSYIDPTGHDALDHARLGIQEGSRVESIPDPAEREAEEREIIRLLEAEP